MSIILDHVNYVYGDDTALAVHALKDINLVIPDGQFIGLIGHTGSGKSTLVQHLNGLIKPTGGSIYFNGEDIHADDYDKKKLRSKVGLVFQYPEHQLFEETVEKDIGFGPKNMGLSAEEISERVHAAAEFAGIPEKLLSKSPFDLSGGQKRRVAIAGIMAMRPEIIILDEATSALDNKSEAIVQKALENLMRDKTVFVIAHRLSTIKNADTIIVINDGRLAEIGTHEELLKIENGQYKNLYEMQFKTVNV